MSIAKAIVLLLVAAAIAPAPAAAGPRDIVPVGPDPGWGCVQDEPPRLSVKGRFGMNASPSFRRGAGVLAARERVARRRLRRARTESARARAEAELERIAATRRGLARCRAGRLRAPAASRRPFAFFCLHGYTLPTAMVDGACAVNLRPRGEKVQAVYDQLDVTLGGECRDDGGALAGPEDMDAVFPLYIVRCQMRVSPRGVLPVGESWDVLAMESEFCNELLGVESGCPPPKPAPPADPRPRPRPTPPANPMDDCIVMRMESEFGNC